MRLKVYHLFGDLRTTIPALGSYIVPLEPDSGSPSPGFEVTQTAGVALSHRDLIIRGGVVDIGERYEWNDISWQHSVFSLESMYSLPLVK